MYTPNNLAKRQSFFLMLFVCVFIGNKIHGQPCSFQVNKKENKLFQLKSSSTDIQHYCIYEHFGKYYLIQKNITGKIDYSLLMDSLEVVGFTPRYKWVKYNRKCDFKFHYFNLHFDSIDAKTNDSIFAFDFEIHLTEKKLSIYRNYVYHHIQTKVSPTQLIKILDNYDQWEFIHYKGTHLYEFSFNLMGIYFEGDNNSELYWPFLHEEYFYRQ